MQRDPIKSLFDPVYSKKMAEIAHREMMREYDLFYLQLQKTLSRLGKYSEMRRQGMIYKYIKFKDSLRGKVMNARLEPGGCFDGIMLVGTNPGTASSLQNLWEDPFGKHLSTLLEEAQLDRKDLWMTNVYKYKTEGNRPLTEKEAKKGWRELQMEIPFVSPRVIGCLGDTASRCFGLGLNEEGKYDTIPVITMYHPSYIRRNSSNMELRSNFINRLKLLKKRYDESAVDSKHARGGSKRR